MIQVQSFYSSQQSLGKVDDDLVSPSENCRTVTRRFKDDLWCFAEDKGLNFETCQKCGNALTRQQSTGLSKDDERQQNDNYTITVLFYIQAPMFRTERQLQ